MADVFRLLTGPTTGLFVYEAAYVLAGASAVCLSKFFERETESSPAFDD